MRQRLLDATVQLLSREGEPLTTKAIADAAHVSVGTFYRYFNDRDEILGVLLDSAVREISNDLAAAVGRALDLEIDASTQAIVESLTESFERNAPVLRAFLDAVGPGTDSELGRGVETALFPLARVIPARHRPDLGPAQLDDLVFVTMGFAATGCLRIALQRPRNSDREAMIDVTARMLAAALGPSPAGST